MDVAVLDSLDGDLRDDVRALIRDVEARDGAPPLSDQAMLRLGSRGPHVVARMDGRLAGYAQLDGETAEVADLSGTADALLATLEGLRPEVIVWSHGKHSPVGPAAAARGYAKHRALWQLRRSLAELTELADLPDKALPPGVSVRPFVPGRDEDAWLAVNAAAFADHAEQGRWTRADLEAREAEPWFDPAGFLLAWRDDALLGFHWTKVHDGGIGEVYVLGVSPAAQGLGLGPALLVAGLRHLAGRGLREAMLYVDDSNAGALAMYRKYGFDTYDVDVQYQRATA